MTEKLEESYIVCRLRIPLHPGQSYLQSVPAEYPDLLVEITSYLPVDPTEVVVNLRVSGNVPMDEVVEKIRASPDVTSMEVVGRAEHSALLRVRSRFSDPSVIKTAQEFQLLPDFPAFIKEGNVTTVVVSSAETIRNLYARLKEGSPGTAIDSIRREALDAFRSSLTPHQAEMFKLAMSSGFWDVPRRTNLTDIASMLGVSKSTLHETLSKIESKLMHEMGEKFYRPL